MNQSCCPSCGHELAGPVPDSCPACAFDLSSRDMVFEARRRWWIWEMLFYSLGTLLSLVLLTEPMLTHKTSWPSFGMGLFIAITAGTRLIGFLRFPNRREYLRVGKSGIQWKTRGRAPVALLWNEVHSIHYMRWYDWVVLQLRGPKIKFMPARFRPKHLSPLYFGGLIADAWGQARMALNGNDKEG